MSVMFTISLFLECILKITRNLENQVKNLIEWIVILFLLYFVIIVYIIYINSQCFVYVFHLFLSIGIRHNNRNILIYMALSYQLSIF